MDHKSVYHFIWFEIVDHYQGKNEGIRFVSRGTVHRMKDDTSVKKKERRIEWKRRKNRWREEKRRGEERREERRGEEKRGEEKRGEGREEKRGVEKRRRKK